jgi:hypothetical protein
MSLLTLRAHLGSLIEWADEGGIGPLTLCRELLQAAAIHAIETGQAPRDLADILTTACIQAWALYGKEAGEA